MSLSIDPAERARRLGNVAGILINLAREARLAAQVAEKATSGQPSVDDAATGDEGISLDRKD
jgi:hypothetical protein